ncbi:bifunctional tRNA (5-methylaminomethyl-2-thiouridine)(34)-methyltransferase MnmD/FAD-dependent 5-carboxymethylaminomethyl-2-thiouridine(34) oxidoreductase MnmC [Caballeronia sp. LZ035]|uniref:bifunctional tRNA (5-methylaminomethyl-2-thiouridine)(34)-methyltransferase MnmD/FAD-dependent 5-carboxymethylaminomethyl-2-thiouridine(34) oxidoreductase MnmC n=1 Tax=Caballeronia sp. LZ035 TaxID=3038568 RepID=UPI00285C8BA3|nr:bifunctional tRNA (5-methylaminomethyl-2-thiouridine)(34)-methyltransferase MnmD/FAD-dependent 5-carboxymethylaminomethyl-2-thiouridine(34) oxidoreductase MnmC [Caballeronia sp. LZ035]MDR5755527.1 bifunctional tRNA (5-methylaminomethyl-2-thiouridine)(34)-methyltransferase MnmD/FAD-dependent 5-carboxymethylaminomethyl-2-thiouridine(34) oxidoreductase MnmC [Caballeronia sp. LZ035]
MTEPSLLASHDLPARWRNRRVFTIVDLSFTPGEDFLAAWQRWLDDEARCERLHVVAVASLAALDHPPANTGSSLEAELLRAWPMRVPGLHRLEFAAGRVVLTLAVGERQEMLSKLWLRADALHVDVNGAHDSDARMLCKSLARLAGDDATVCITAPADTHATFEGALAAAGFTCHASDANDRVTGRFAPRWRVRRHEPPRPDGDGARAAIVVGAGLAGCAMTSRLTARGFRVTLIDRHEQPARDASGNPAGVFHPIVWRDDSVAARLTRAGFLCALQRWLSLEHAGHALHRSSAGLLQIADTPEDADALAAAIARFAYPSEYVQALTRSEASRMAGVDVARGGWFFPHGGAISPASLCAAQLAESAGRTVTRMNTEVARIAREDGLWRAFDASGDEIARAPAMILANARDAARLAGLHGQPTRIVRGQLSMLASHDLNALRVPVIGEGYAVPLGAGSTLIGATYDIDDPDPQMRAEGHVENLERVAGMLPGLPFTANTVHGGRVAFRCVTSDRMPMIGQLADEAAARRDARRLSGAWPLDLPRMPGLYGAFAFGSRGLIWAALAAELVAAQIEGEPWPIERDLAEAVDPARFLLRALRHGEIGPDELSPPVCG